MAFDQKDALVPSAERDGRVAKPSDFTPLSPTRETRVSAPVDRSFSITSQDASGSAGCRLLAEVWNATFLPSPERAGAPLEELPLAPRAPLRDASTTAPVARSLTKTSPAVSVSSGCRLVACDVNATLVPVDDRLGVVLSPLALGPAAVVDATTNSPVVRSFT